MKMADTDTRRDTTETTVILEGPAPFLDVVYETIEGHVCRTGEAYEQVITGVGGEDVGEGDHEEEAVLHLYILAGVDADEALEWVALALDRIADDNDMDLARRSVQVRTDDDELIRKDGGAL
jgi:hypothetical protein